MATIKHIHKYQRIQRKYSGGVWACALPDCTHFMPKNVEDQVEGKLSVCWTCGEPFILDEDNMKNDRPVCFKCTGDMDLDALDALLKEKGIE